MLSPRLDIEDHGQPCLRKRVRLPFQLGKNRLGCANTCICLIVALSGVMTLATQNIAQGEEKAWIPGNPVTHESVEAGLLKRRESLRASPAFKKNDAPTHVHLAEVLNQQGDPNGAIEEYQAAITLDPALPEAYRGLGAVHLDTHQWSLAEDALRTSTRLDHTDSQTFYWLGRALMAQHKFSDAKAAFTSATELNPQDAEAFADLGLVRMAQSHASDAAKALTQAIQLRPDYAEAHHRLEIVRASQQDPANLPRAARDILNLLFRRE